ncbi:hypothetical protein RHGRI_031841 [Rhododendron griersonianum]|uniref:C3H1-type domain-containing protein n=1 Tax=Rhododendron griersonianum TaxID=479676 RepID=A0AAV6IA37_9ERIC|nr:hypothetical protein RHGRI_031841 [Rhododendron griersonianum]
MFIFLGWLSERSRKGILGCTEDDVVSTDVEGDNRNMDEHYNDSCPTEPEQAPTVTYPQHPERKICYVYMSIGDCQYEQYEQKCRYHHPIRQSAPTKKVKLEKCQITEKVEAIFGSACSLLRRALEVAWFNRHATYGIKFKDTLQSQVPF